MTDSSFYRELYRNFKIIPRSVIYQNRLPSYLKFLGADYGNKIEEFLLSSYSSKIKKCLEHKDFLLSKDLIIGTQLEVLARYKTNLLFLYASSRIAHKIFSIPEINSCIQRNEEPNINSTEDIISVDDISDVSRLLIGNLAPLEYAGEDIVNPRGKNNKNYTKTQLKDYQQNTLNQLCREDRGFKNIVIGKTGSGKTLLALAYAEYMYRHHSINRIVFVAERNENILKREAEKHLPNYYSLLKYSFCNYYTMHKFINGVGDFSNTLFIFDEVHNIKNKESKRCAFLSSLNIKYFLGITATLYDKPSDLVGICRSLNIPSEYSRDPAVFRNKFITLLESNHMEKLVVNMNRVPVTVGKKTRNEIRTKLILREAEGKRTSGLSKMHLILPSLSNEKLSKIAYICEQHKDEKILVFTQYLDTFEDVHSHLSLCLDRKVDCVDGSVSKIGKDSKIYNFQEGDTDILISTSVLAASYNLQKASVVIIAEPTYSIIQRLQTLGRVQRLGQENHIHIYEIFCTNTLEEDIYSIIDKKEILLGILETDKEKEALDRSTAKEILSEEVLERGL